ncbi:glycosyltransferase family 4 protein [Rhizobium sp. BK008]|uniref:glycosyltransferase family 4 protein n=1 Tax=Rhizobium sp. BK008 TaxID=2587094 RepID=UPI00161489EA|nr:glycosyltransferase family 4 protein [Rhizobium sp. BK008]MBB4255948.1 glycosyltransferase involved in cell wall biosynthesis [Rhizobium sp. BK008]
MPKILFFISTGLGWKTVGQRIHDAIQLQQDDQHEYVSFSASKLGRRVIWHTGYHTHAGLHVPIFDPYTVISWQANKFRSRIREFDAIVAATQAQAAPFVRNPHGVPIFTVIDSTRRLYKTEFGGSHIRDAAIARERMLFQDSEHVISISQWAANDVVNHYGISSDRVSVVPVASQPSTYPITAFKPEGRLNVLFVGGDFERKGGRELLEWQTSHLHHFINLHLVTERSAERHEVPNTTWYGPVPNEKVVRELLPNVDVLIHPTHRDCSAIVVAEAAMAGVPSIASRVGGISELIQNGVTGYLCEVGDRHSFIRSVEALFQDRDKLRDMGREARLRASRMHEPNIVYKEIVRIVERSLAGRVKVDGMQLDQPRPLVG